MPDREIHRYISTLFTGKSHDEIHKVLDGPVKFLGRKHRVLFHNPTEAAMIGYRLAGVEGALVALMHVTVDQVCSRDKKLERMMRKMRHESRRRRG